MNEGKINAIKESNRQRFIKKFGTDNIREVLGEDVLSLRKSIHDRLLEFGDSHTSHWIRTYLPEDLKWLIPHQVKFKIEKQKQASASSLDERKRKYLESTFGTSDIYEILGEDVLNGSKSIFARFKELGKYSPSHALRFIESYAPKPLMDELFPFRDEAEKLFRDNYSEEQIAQMSLPAQKNIITSYAKYGRAAFNAFTPEENKEFLNSLNIDPLVPIPSTTRGIHFKARCMICGHINEFSFQSNRIPTVCQFCNEAGKTRLESLIQKALEDHGVDILPKARGFLTSELGFWQEIDIYVPSLKIGFEINGALTHNSGISPFHDRIKPKNYHKLKSDKALSKGILLYHIWEHWGDPEMLTNLVLAKCRVFRKTYYARKLSVVLDPPTRDVEDFLNRNHKQGFCRCSVSVALYDKDKLIQFIGFVITSDTAELVRNASEQGAQILGGIQRLFKYSIMELKSRGVSKIITFADRDLTPSPECSVYSRLGFKFVEDSGQTMSYYVYKNRSYFDKQVYNRRYFQKQFLEKRLSIIPGWTFNEKESEQENLARAGIYPIYNSGCFKFEYFI